MSPKYKRILLKLSGETLGGKRGTGFDYDTIRALAESVISIYNLGVEVGIVIGGGNIFRGAIELNAIAEPYIKRRADRHLEKKRVVIFAAGTGNPFFTTDTAAVLRASEVGAEIVIKATKIDGVYDKDPKLHSDAVRYDVLNYDEVLKKHLKVMDATAIAFCRDNQLPILVLDYQEPDAILRAVCGETVGTLIKQRGS